MNTPIKKGISLCLSSLLIFGLSLPLYAAFFSNVEITTGFPYTLGYSTYQIGGNTYFQGFGSINFHFPISELKFPLNTLYASVSARTTLMDRVRLSGTCGTNFTRTPAGDMEDSDWLDDSHQKDIYSTSKTDVRLVQAQAGMEYLLNTIAYSSDITSQFWLGLSYEYQKLDYTASELTQYDLTDPGSEPIRVSGNVITFLRTTKIPYLTLSSQHVLENLFGFPFLVIDASFGYSPWAEMRDQDDHLLRKKLSTGSLRGIGTKASASVKLGIAPHLSTTLGVMHELVETSGTQTQIRYANTDEGNAGYIGDIDTRAFSRSTSIYGFLTYDMAERPSVFFPKPASLNASIWINAAWVPDTLHAYGHPVVSFEFPMIQKGMVGFSWGIGFEQSTNRVSSVLSEGIATQVPIYGRFQFSLNESLYLGLGCGYNWIKNRIDDQAKNELARNGFPNANEKIDPYLFWLGELEYRFTPDFRGFIQVKIADAKVIFTSSPYSDVQPLSMSQIQAGLRIQTPTL